MKTNSGLLETDTTPSTPQSSTMSLLHRTDQSGQATVEYVVAGMLILVLIVVLGTMAQALLSGVFVEHAASSASHAGGERPIEGVVGDIILY